MIGTPHRPMGKGFKKRKKEEMDRVYRARNRTMVKGFVMAVVALMVLGVVAYWVSAGIAKVVGG